MQYVLQYNQCAIIIYIVVLATHLLKKRTHELHNKIFTSIVADSLLCAIINMFNTCGNMGIIHMPMSVLIALDYGYFITLNIIVIGYAAYTIALVNNRIITVSKILNALTIVPAFAMVVLICANPWIHSLFYYDNGVYQRGSLQVVMYAIDMYFTVFGMVYILMDKKISTIQLKASISLYFVVGCVTSLTQFLFPRLLMQHLGISVCELMILLALQKPEEYIDSQMGVYNSKAFEKIFAMNINSGRNMDILIVNIQDVEFLVQTVGMRIENDIVKEIAEFFEEISDGNVYRIDVKTFFFLVEGRKSSKRNKRVDIPIVDTWIKKINERFKSEWGNDGEKVYINHKMMKLCVPDDMTELDIVYFCNAYFNDMTPGEDNMVSIKDIDFNRANRRARIESIIKRAITEDNFEMYYQPIYSFEKKRIVSAEALIRLKDPDEGMVPPDEFIPIAENNGMIIKIGEMVFEKVFDFISRNDIRKMGLEYIEVNLSIVQCMQKELSEKIFSLMNEYGITKDMINLEITETAAADSPKMLVQNIEKLSEEGISFSLDDFGTGYSNISSLMSLPLNIIKFDKSMVDMITTHEFGRNIIDSSVAMVKKMGMLIVAEGIEEEEQIKIMKEMGIDFLQGYYFSRPLPEKDFISYVEEGVA